MAQTGGGITAIQLTTGEKLWHKSLAEPGQRVNNGAAATAMQGVVFIAGNRWQTARARLSRRL